MTDQLHPEAAPTEAGGSSAVDQIADLLREDGDVEETTNEYEADSYDGDEDGGVPGERVLAGEARAARAVPSAVERCKKTRDGERHAN